MNIYKSLFLGLVCSAGMHCTFAQTTVWNPDNQNGTFTGMPYCCIGRFGKLGNGRICFGSL